MVVNFSLDREASQQGRPYKSVWLSMRVIHLLQRRSQSNSSQWCYEVTWWGDFLSDFKIISILVVASSGQTYHLDSWVLARWLALERRKDRCRGKQPASQGKVRQASPSCPEAAAAAWNPAHWPPTQKCPAGLNHTEYDPKVPIKCPERDPVVAQKLLLLLEPCPLTTYTQGLTKVPLEPKMP